MLSKEDVRLAYSIYEKGYSSKYVANIFNVDLKTILRGFRRHGYEVRSNKVNSRRFHINNENYFKNIDTEDKSYWLGLIYADGYISIKKYNQKMFGISLTERDIDILHKLNKCLDSSYPIRIYKPTNSYYNSKNYGRLLVTSEIIVDDLIRHGVMESKTNILKRPKIEYNLIRHFIRGYLDGDGSIKISNNNKGRKEFTVSFTGTDDILLYIANYLKDNNLVNRINKLSKRKEGQIVSNIDYGGNIQAQRILDHLYINSDLYIERKYKRYEELKIHNCRSHR